uniref:RWP-RK domain-containing protein n=1 Tax=Arcella intermedia TaxID=1963864 RepID=A0A6B2LAU8_9EUKA
MPNAMASGPTVSPVTQGKAKPTYMGSPQVPHNGGLAAYKKPMPTNNTVHYDAHPVYLPSEFPPATMHPTQPISSTTNANASNPTNSHLRNANFGPYSGQHQVPPTSQMDNVTTSAHNVHSPCGYSSNPLLNSLFSMNNMSFISSPHIQDIGNEQSPPSPGREGIHQNSYSVADPNMSPPSNTLSLFPQASPPGSPPSHISPPSPNANNNADSKYVDITEYLNLPQSQAAKKLNVPTSTLSKRWKEAVRNRKWPYRAVSKLDKEIMTILYNIPQNNANGSDMAPEVKAKLGKLLKERQELLKPVIIRL